MDNAVALVEAYLRVNGYFTVTEYPIILRDPAGGYRTATDLDVIAFRFPHVHPGALGDTGDVEIPDPALGAEPGAVDMIVAEVKEGPAMMNAAVEDTAVLAAALHRFGCCSGHAVEDVVRTLQRKGQVVVPSGHQLRLLAFGNGRGRGGRVPHATIPMGHVLDYLSRYVRSNWDALRHSQTKDPAFGFLVMLEKAHQRTAFSGTSPS